MKKIILATMVIWAAIGFTGCSTDASIASKNLAKAAEQFEIDRRIVFINTWTDKYLLKVEGKCSIQNQSSELEVTCKTGKDSYKKHNLGLSKNVTYVSEQMESIGVSVYHYRVMFKPQSIVRDLDFVGDTTDMIHNRN